jgi:hypothetical protein
MMELPLGTIERFTFPLLVGFVCLNFLDVYTTTLAMTYGSAFRELNPVAALLFDKQFQGYLVAIAFKYLPLIPILYIVFVGDESGRHETQIRTLKFTALVVLAGADIYLLYVVGIHNFQSLLMMA